METEILNLLDCEKKLKAKKIANLLGLDKSEVNSFLYKKTDLFYKDKDHFWSSSQSKSLIIEFECGWVDCKSFEEILSNKFKRSFQKITFSIPKKCQILLDAAARLLALCNQLALEGKSITVNFHDLNTLGYLNRVGFVELLSENINILPDKTNYTNKEVYKGKNNNVVEFGKIDPDTPNDSLPEQLKNSFVIHAGKEYADFAFTAISELFENVVEHSETPVPGFAALQLYKGSKKHIQTVISDSGKGIIGTLKPVLNKEYPEIANTLNIISTKGKIKLLRKILEKGGISRLGKNKERGLGLHQSQKKASQYNTTITIRQKDFEIELHYKNGELVNTINTLDLTPLSGTHISFKIYLD